MIKIFAKRDCGCCTESMYFETIESADVAFQKAGLGNGIMIVDDLGEEHKGIDTFYGFSLDEDEVGSRSLQYLFEFIEEKI